MSRQSASAGGAMTEPRRCSRCEFLHDEKIPVGEDGLCLWCRLTLAGVDLRDFYTSGEWMEEIEWRGEETPGDELRLCIRKRMKKNGDTVKAVANLYGIGTNGLYSYMNKVDCYVPHLSVRLATVLGKYLDISIGQVVELAGGPRMCWGYQSGTIMSVRPVEVSDGC